MKGTQAVALPDVFLILCEVARSLTLLILLQDALTVRWTSLFLPST